MQHLVTILTLLGGAAVVVAGFFVINKAPIHANLGGWSDILLPLGVTAVISVVVGGAMIGGAWAMWRAEYKMASQLLGIIGLVSAFLVWRLGDALNVLLDDSSPSQHETELVKFVSSSGKNSSYFVVTSWRVSGERISLDLPIPGVNTFAPGLRLRVTTRQGAFGRPYAVRLEPIEAPKNP